MEKGEDFVSMLLGHIDGRNCFISALLLLTPNELKACRLVSTTWNKFIMEELWGRKGGREKLGQKLVEGWRNMEARMVRIGKAKDEMESIFCNKAHKRHKGKQIMEFYEQIS